jgi:hypothetical protein
MYSSTLLSISALDGVGGQRHAPAALPREIPGTHCVRAWVDPRASLDRCGKSRFPPGFDPGTVQLVASRYTDWAIPVPSGHAISTVYSVCVCVCLKPYLHSMQCACATLSSVPSGSTIFFRIISKRHEFRGKKRYWAQNVCFDFL